MAVDLKITGDANQLENEVTKVQRQLVEMEQRLKDLATTGKRGTKETAEGAKAAGGAFDKMGAGIGKSVASWMAGLTSVQGALGALKNLALGVFDDMDQASARAGERLRSAALKDFAALSQLGLGDPHKHAGSIKHAREFFAMGGAENLGESANTIKQLMSAGITTDEERKLFAGLYGIMGTDLGGLAAAATTIKAGMGEAETGDVRAILSKALAASAINPQDVPELVKATVTATPYAKEMGWSDEEVMAAVGTFARVIGSANEAGTALAALGKALTREGMFQGLSAPEQVKKLSDMKLSEQQLVGMLGAETVQALAYGLTQATDEKGDQMFEGLTLTEALDKLASKGLSEKQLAETLGPAVVDALTRATSQYQSFAGLGLAGATEKLAGLGLTAPQMIEFLGRQEAFLGYSTMMQTKDTTYKDVLKDVRAAQEKDLVGRVIESAELQPEIRVAREELKARARSELARIDQGAERLAAEGIRERIKGDRAEMGAKGEDDFLVRGVQRYGGDEAVIRTYGTEAEQRRFYGVKDALEEGGLYAPSPPRVIDTQEVSMAPGVPASAVLDVIDILKDIRSDQREAMRRQFHQDRIAWETLMPPPGPTPMTQPTVDRSS